MHCTDRKALLLFWKVAGALHSPKGIGALHSPKGIKQSGAITLLLLNFYQRKTPGATVLILINIFIKINDSNSYSFSPTRDTRFWNVAGALYSPKGITEHNPGP